MAISFLIKIVKMIYSLFCYTSSIISFLCNISWNVLLIIGGGMPWLIILLILVCVVSKFVKLKRSTHLKSFIDKFENVNENDSDYLYWPIANRGSSFDVPENSHFALKSVIYMETRERPVPSKLFHFCILCSAKNSTVNLFCWIWPWRSAGKW